MFRLDYESANNSPFTIGKFGDTSDWEQYPKACSTDTMKRDDSS